MSINSNQLLPKLVESFGNVYECVNYVASEARTLCSSSSHPLTESQAMTQILSGQPIHECQATTPHKTARGAKLIAIDELLCTVDDPEIVAAVTRSVFKSWREHHLVYDYISVHEINKQARIRILTNIVWYTYLITPRRKQS